VRTQLELRAVGLGEAAGRAFPSPMTVQDVRAATINNPTVLMHFEDILERLDPDDELRPPVATWVQEQRSARKPPRPDHDAQLAALRQELRETRERLEALQESRSWKVTRPVRAATDQLRRLRG
jgi:hypothetical protein